MANYLKFFLLISLLFLNINFSFAQEDSDELRKAIQNGDYEKIYENVEEADFDYIFGIDPYQTDEYTKYMYSPYPLFRSGVTLIFKSKVIPAGYYLLTPREKNGKTYVLFKENGKVSYMVTPYKISSVNEEFYKEKIPQPKLTKTQSISKKTMDFIGKKWGKKNQRTPIPQAFIEFNDEGLYWDMILYYGDKKYYLLFKKG